MISCGVVQASVAVPLHGKKRKAKDTADGEAAPAPQPAAAAAAGADACPFHCATEDKPDGLLDIIHDRFVTAHTAGLTVATTVRSRKPLIWGTVRTHLTWSLANDADATLAACVDDITAAFSSWSAACNVAFYRAPNGKGLITIRWATKAEEARDKGVIAAAFFPGEADRSVKLYKLFKTQGPFRLAVLRHEIGHLLGFRHEHIWFPDNPTGEEPTEGDMGAKLVTNPDKDSIMNYLKLWSDAQARIVTNLSRLDRDGARSLYGAPSASVDFLM